MSAPDLVAQRAETAMVYLIGSMARWPAPDWDKVPIICDNLAMILPVVRREQPLIGALAQVADDLVRFAPSAGAIASPNFERAIHISRQNLQVIMLMRGAQIMDAIRPNLQAAPEEAAPA